MCSQTLPGDEDCPNTDKILKTENLFHVLGTLQHAGMPTCGTVEHFSPFLSSPFLHHLIFFNKSCYHLVKLNMAHYVSSTLKWSLDPHLLVSSCFLFATETLVKRNKKCNLCNMPVPVKQGTQSLKCNWISIFIGATTEKKHTSCLVFL